MKVRSVEDLQDHIDKEIAWRKKELTNIKFLIEHSPQKHIDTNIRVGIIMLYAHWEGFIREVGSYYVNYISNRGLRYSDLKDNFIALCMRSKFQECSKTQKTSSHLKVIDLLINQLDLKANLPTYNVIATNSNLNYETFEEILLTLGIDDSGFELKKNLINESLLGNRNAIAHGQRHDVDKATIDILYKEIFQILDLYKTKIVAAAQNGDYLRNK